MTAALAAPFAAVPAPHSVSVARALRFELVKLAAQWRIRLLLAVCCVVPAVFVGVVSLQTILPSDTVFGRWMNQTGWAGALVVLAFSCTWALPLLTCLVAGDSFAAEDRLGTWPHLLVSIRSPRRIFAAKALASLVVIVVMCAALVLSGIVGGLVAVGNRPLVGLDGQLIQPSAAAGTVLLAWAYALAPTLAFAAVGLLGSVAMGRSPVGLLLPAVLAFLLQLVQLLPLPVAVRVALPSNPFMAWRALFTSPPLTGLLLLGLAVSLLWAVVSTGLAYRLFVRRDFTDTAYDGPGRAIWTAVVLPLVALLAGTAAVVAVATPASGTGVDSTKLEQSVATTFAHLYRLQTAELHRPDVTEQQLATGASCDKGGDLVDDVGPGNDWRCVVTWHLPGATATGSAIYQLDVIADGRYLADGDGPKEVNGYFPLHIATGDVPNPLWQFDGYVDLLAPPPGRS